MIMYDNQGNLKDFIILCKTLCRMGDDGDRIYDSDEDG